MYTLALEKLLSYSVHLKRYLCYFIVQGMNVICKIFFNYELYKPIKILSLKDMQSSSWKLKHSFSLLQCSQLTKSRLCFSQRRFGIGGGSGKGSIFCDLKVKVTFLALFWIRISAFATVTQRNGCRSFGWIRKHDGQISIEKHRCVRCVYVTGPVSVTCTASIRKQSIVLSILPCKNIVLNVNCLLWL